MLSLKEEVYREAARRNELYRNRLYHRRWDFMLASHIVNSADGFSIRIDETLPFITGRTFKELEDQIPREWLYDADVVETRWFENDRGQHIFVIELESREPGYVPPSERIQKVVDEYLEAHPERKKSIPTPELELDQQTSLWGRVISKFKR